MRDALIASATGSNEGIVVRERAADVVDDVCWRRVKRHVGKREAGELEKPIDDVGERWVLGGKAPRVQRVCERQQRRDLVLITDRVLQIVEGVGHCLLPSAAQRFRKLRLVDVGCTAPPLTTRATIADS